MTLCLSTTIIKPEKDISINNAIILLHGYGGDGKDISMLTLNWKRFLPNTIFLCPDGHEECKINPAGFQWFDLTKDDPSYILEESKKAENKLQKYIEEVNPKNYFINKKNTKKIRYFVQLGIFAKRNEVDKIKAKINILGLKPNIENYLFGGKLTK